MKSRCNFRPHIYRPAPIQPSISLPVPLPDLRPSARQNPSPKSRRARQNRQKRAGDRVLGGWLGSSRRGRGRLARLIASSAPTASSTTTTAAPTTPEETEDPALRRPAGGERAAPAAAENSRADLPEGSGPRRRRRGKAAPTCRWRRGGVLPEEEESRPTDARTARPSHHLHAAEVMTPV
jgi:hypothetical protein